VDKEALFRPYLPEDDVEIPGLGTVRVRALSRAEAMVVSSAKGPEAQERRSVSLGMVDPPMSEAEVGRWARARPAGDLELVSRRIAALSGMLEDSAKAAYKSDGGRSGAGVRDVPGAEAGDDGGPASDGDE
jgi:hypothetical protein